MSGQKPTHTVTEQGHTYRHPHVNIDVTPWYPTDGWTRWEIQEMTRCWRNAVLAAERTHQLAHNALEGLHGGGLADLASDVHSMTREPTQMAEALLSMRRIHDGIVHRLVVEGRTT